MTTLIDSGDILTWHIRALFVLTVVLVGAAAMPKTRAMLRHRLLAYGMLAAIVVPAIAAFIPAAAAIQIATPAVAATPVALATAADPVSLAIASSVAQGPAVTPVGSSAGLDWAALLIGAWLAGCGYGLFRVATSALGSRLLRRGAAAPGPQLRAIHHGLQRETGFRARLGVTPRVAVPIVVGFADPMILLPRAATQWSELRIRAVLSHELGHIAQGDHRWFPVVHLTRALLWCNPLAWLALRHFLRHAEFAADDAALATGIRASTYATELLSLACATVGRAPLLAVPALGHSDIAERIRRVLASRTALVSLRRVLPVALGTIGAGACIAVLQPAEQDDGSSVGTAQAEDLREAPGPDATRGTVPPAADAWRMRIGGGEVAVLVDTQERTRQSLQGASDVRKGHLLVRVYDELKDALYISRPVIVEADSQTTFADLVDVLYTAGRAGVTGVSFGLAVQVQGAERTVSLAVPTFEVGVEPPQRRRFGVMLSGFEKSVRVRERMPEETGPACRLETEGAAQADWIDALCARGDGVPVQITVSATDSTRYETVVETMIAMSGPCVDTIILEAGADSGDVLPAAPACDASTFR